MRRSLPHNVGEHLRERELQFKALQAALTALDDAREPCCSDPHVVQRLNSALSHIRQALDDVHAHYVRAQRFFAARESESTL